MPLADEMKAARARAGKSLAECGALLGISGEGYRKKELGLAPVTGAELATLALAYGTPLMEAFPSYLPTEGERALCRQLAA